MRVSAIPGEPGYRGFFPCHVYLEGVEMTWVISADEETGEIVRHVTDAEGNIVIDYSDPANAKTTTESLRGAVRIVPFTDEERSRM